MSYCLPSLLAAANQMSQLLRLTIGAVYLEEKSVYMDNLPGKTIHWETRTILQYY